MALTITYPNTSPFDLSAQYGATRIVYAKITGDTSYPGGTGYAVTPGSFGFSNLIAGILPPQPTSAQTRYAWYDPNSKGIRLIIAGNVTLSEVATATDVSGVTLDVAVVGY